MIGATLLHYRIIKPLGRGGMGEVYLAEDTRLDRQVAIKVLPERLRASPERLERFRREAKAAATLNHPNIAHIYALEEAAPVPDGDGGEQRPDRSRDARSRVSTNATPVLFIVMEYVDGAPLSHHIPPGGMALGNGRPGGSGGGQTHGSAPTSFFEIFIPLADALAHAHGQGRVHRDLKPSNIMIAEDGTPKILDFGLARILDPDPVQAVEKPEIDSDAPTKTMDTADHAAAEAAAEAAARAVPSLTRGMLVGTPQYMSPEQAERKETDARTDLFSFGVVMYEAITGKRAFDGDTLESIIGRILEAEPQPAPELRPVTPYPLWTVIRRCLKKDRGQRTQTAQELHAELQDVQAEVQAGMVLVDASTIPAPSPEPQEKAPTPIWRRPMPVAVAGVLLAVMTAIAGWLLKPMPELPLLKFSEPMKPGTINQYDGPVISPDGTMVAFSQNNTLWVREFGSAELRQLSGAEGAVRPFWSPDSRFIGYFHNFTGIATLRTVSAQGGPSTRVTDLPPQAYTRGAAWTPDGEIIFGMTFIAGSAGTGSLYTVSARGGAPQPWLQPDSARGEAGITFPHLLPDGESLLYTVTTVDNTGVLILQHGDTRTELIRHPGETLAFPAYSPTGHIVYQRGFPASAGIWALPADLSSRTATADPFPVAVGQIPSVSKDGMLVYSSINIGATNPSQLVRVDRQGAVLDTIGRPQPDLENPALSPDGRRVVVTANVQGNNSDLWIHDAERGATTRLTSDPFIDWSPAWSPFGDQLIWPSNRNGNYDLYRRFSDGRGTPELALNLEGVGVLGRRIGPATAPIWYTRPAVLHRIYGRCRLPGMENLCRWRNHHSMNASRPSRRMAGIWRTSRMNRDSWRFT